MNISRRDFLKYCSVSAMALGLSATDLLDLKEALANPAGPSVIWLQGSACTGCTISLLNMISYSPPRTVAEALVTSVNLAYHPNLSAAAGNTVVEEVVRIYERGGYALAVEGGVPTAFEGNTCWPGSYNGVGMTFLEAVTVLASRATAVVCVGTCASWGGIPASGSNPTAAMGVGEAIGSATINIAGCPPHPDWIVSTMSRMILGQPMPLDAFGRPQFLFNETVHRRCPYREDEDRCLRERGIGCRGPETRATCPTLKWNNGTNWCVGADAPCIACTEPIFPATPLNGYADDDD